MPAPNPRAPPRSAADLGWRPPPNRVGYDAGIRQVVDVEESVRWRL